MDTTDQQAVTVAQEDVNAAMDLCAQWDIMSIDQVAEFIASIRLASVSSASAEPYKFDNSDYDAFVTFEGWLQEYRRTMSSEVIHSWAADMVESGKALLCIRDRILSDALRSIAASPEPVPATNQAGGVIDKAALAFILEDVANDTIAPSEGVKRILAALATQPATSQEPFGYWVTQKHADPVLLRKPAYIPEPSDLRTVTPLYATPTPPTLSEDLREKAQALLDFIGDRDMRVYASDLVVRDLRAALAQVKAS